MTGVASGAGTTLPECPKFTLVEQELLTLPECPKFTPAFSWGLCFSIYIFLCSV